MMTLSSNSTIGSGSLPLGDLSDDGCSCIYVMTYEWLVIRWKGLTLWYQNKLIPSHFSTGIWHWHNGSDLSGQYGWNIQMDQSDTEHPITRAVARILFQPRQRVNRGSGGRAPAESRGRVLVRGEDPPRSWKLFSSWMPYGNGKSTTILLFCDLFIIQQKHLKLHVYNNAAMKCHWWPFVKRFALCNGTILLSCASVMLAYCGQVVGWIKMPLGPR